MTDYGGDTTPTTTVTPVGVPGAPVADITARISDEIRATLQEKMEGAELFESEDERGHHHAERKPSIITAAASGLVNFLLMFGMCCAYGIIIFSDTHNRTHVPLAIKMNLSTSLVVGLLCAAFSKVPVAIGGPDINPAVFLGLFVEAMAPAIAADLGLEYPEGSSGRRRLMEEAAEERNLASVASSSFCLGEHLAANPEACKSYHDQLTATTIFATAFSTLLMGIVFVLMGSMKLTRYMAYVPTSIMEAFLACVGYKVFATAVKQAEYEPGQFVPAAIIGMSMYFLKAKHIGNPAILMPLGFLLPLGLFFAGVYAFGFDVDELRTDNLMFPKIENVAFTDVWTLSVTEPQNIKLEAWVESATDLAIMVIVVTLDCVLKVVATDSKMPLHVDKDYEVRMHGINNLLLSTTGSAVGYMQLKFNVINYGIIGNVVDRKAGFIYAILCGICYFWTIEPFNYLPRFFIASLLFFAGSGFVAENLWGSRGTNSPLEWLEILLIVVTFIFTGQLVIAVVVGAVLCFITFILKYAKVSVLDGAPHRGGDVRVLERRGPLIQRSIRHITDNWLLVVKLKGYIFFASADNLTNHVFDFLKEQEQRQIPAYRRLKYVVFDCSLLDGMDASAAKAMKRLAANASKASVRVLWTHLTPAFASELRMRGLLTANSKDVFNDIDEVIMQVEHMAKIYLQSVEMKWIGLHPAFLRWSKMMQAQFRYEPFTLVFLSPMYRIGCPWAYCTQVPVHAYSTLLFTPGQSDGYLYLVHSGAVALFEELPDPDKAWGSPVAIYRQGWFLNREILMRAPARYYAVAIEDGEVLCWSQDQWWRMACERPLMMSEMQKTVMKQQARDSNSFDAHAHDTIAHNKGDDAVWDLVHEDLVMRQASFVSDGSGSFSKQPPSLPEEAQVRFNAMETAQCLETFGFYTPQEDSEKKFMPELPESLKADIDYAFTSFAKLLDIRDTEPKIDVPDVVNAIMFAGLFHHPAVYDEKHMFEDPVNRADFVETCRKGWLAPLSKNQVETINRLFGLPEGIDTGGVSLTVSASGLQRALRKVVPGISAEMADAYFMAFRGTDLSTNNQIDVKAFTGIMSLLIRVHEPFYDVMQACREIVGSDKMVSSLEVHWSRLVRASEQRAFEKCQTDAAFHHSGVLTEPEAQEMLWSSDWRLGGRGEGKILGFPEMTSAVLATFNRDAGRLPAVLASESTDEPEIVTCPSAVELTKDHSHFGVEGNLDATMKNMSAVSHPLAGIGQSQRNHSAPTVGELNDPHSLTGDISKSRKSWELQDGIKPSAPSARDLGNRVPAVPPPPGRVESPGTRGSRAMIEIKLNPQRYVLEAIVAILIVLSTTVLVLEPIISGKDEKQTDAEENLWFVVELCITALLAFEFMVRMIMTSSVGLHASGYSQVNLCMDFLAILPAFLDLLASAIDNPEMVHDGLEDVAKLLRVVRFARVSRFASKTTLAAPIATMLVVIWGIYVEKSLSGAKKA